MWNLIENSKTSPKIKCVDFYREFQDFSKDQSRGFLSGLSKTFQKAKGVGFIETFQGFSKEQRCGFLKRIAEVFQRPKADFYVEFQVNFRDYNSEFLQILCFCTEKSLGFLRKPSSLLYVPKMSSIWYKFIFLSYSS